MIAVIFEVWPQDEGKEKGYLDLAASLRPLLDHRDGFISIERFASLTEPGKILSLSFWRDEHSVQTWRNEMPHIAAQLAGRGHLFRDYRLRVASVDRDYGMHRRSEAPSEFQNRA